MTGSALSLQRADGLVARRAWARARRMRVDRRAVVARAVPRTSSKTACSTHARARADRGRELEAAAREAAGDDDARVARVRADHHLEVGRVLVEARMCSSTRSGSSSGSVARTKARLSRSACASTPPSHAPTSALRSCGSFASARAAGRAQPASSVSPQRALAVEADLHAREPAVDVRHDVEVAVRPARRERLVARAPTTSAAASGPTSTARRRRPLGPRALALGALVAAERQPPRPRARRGARARATHAEIDRLLVRDDERQPAERGGVERLVGPRPAREHERVVREAAPALVRTVRAARSIATTSSPSRHSRREVPAAAGAGAVGAGSRAAGARGAGAGAPPAGGARASRRSRAATRSMRSESNEASGSGATAPRARPRPGARRARARRASRSPSPCRAPPPRPRAASRPGRSAGSPPPRRASRTPPRARGRASPRWPRACARARRRGRPTAARCGGRSARPRPAARFGARASGGSSGATCAATSRRPSRGATRGSRPTSAHRVVLVDDRHAQAEAATRAG